MIAVWEKLRTAISRLLRHRAKHSTHNWRAARGVSLHAEQLESRQLLSANQISFDAATSTVKIQGTAQADKVEIWSDATNVYVKLSNPGETLSSTFEKSTVALLKFNGEDGNDQFTNWSELPSLAFGDAGNDLLIGGTGNDRLFGGGDDDLVYGSEGDDELFGEGGNDRLFGGDGIDVLQGGAGDDQLFGGAHDDSLYGGEGADDLRGEEGHDRLSGEAGNDLLIGGTGNDRLFGGGDDDLVYGSEGDDELFGEGGNDRLFGGDGIDFLQGGAGDDQLFGGAHDDSLYGGEGADELRGDDGNDLLIGEAGDDAIHGLGGNDVLVGLEGDDLLEGGEGDDVLIAGAGADRLYGQWGEDLLVGGTTSYDSDNAKLNALRAAWSAPIPYVTRIQQIENAGFAARLMMNESVFDDGLADAVFGGDGQDWFFQTGSMAVFDPVSGTSSGLEGFNLLSALDRFEDRREDEAIQSRLPHASDPVHQREHLALYQIARYDQITHFAVRNGAWTDPATWKNGAVPGADATVLIPMDVAVRVDGVIATRLKSIRVDGSLAFDTTRNTELRVDTLLVTHRGVFEMGTEATPIMSGVTARLLITDNGPIDRSADPFGLSRGLLSHGQVSIHGAEVTSHIALSSSVLAGTQLLILKQAPTGWKVGDTIVVAATTVGTQQNEVRRIAATFGNIVVLIAPLAYDHVAARADFEVHVANVTRNAVIESESQVIDRRGHVMFMHNRNVDIAHAGFYRLGRTDKTQPINDAVVNADWSLQAGTGTNPRARYAVHFHRTGTLDDGNPSTITGSAVVDAAGWGFVNHSSYVDLIDNVAFDVHGAGFITEVGDEIGSFRGNIAIGTTSSGEPVEARKTIQDFGHSGEGYWFQGVGISVTDNIAAGNAGSGFAFYARGLIEAGIESGFLAANLPDPSIAGGAERIDIGAMSVFEFENNVAYASAKGLATWYSMEDATTEQKSLLQNSKFWNNTIGVDLRYTHHTVLRNLTVYNSWSVSQPEIGLSKNAVTMGITYDNLTVWGYRRGIDLPTRGSSIVTGGFFRNILDIHIITGSSRNALLTGFAEMPTIAMVVDPSLTGSKSSQFFANDVVILDFGPFAGQRLYYTKQQSNVVPFWSPIDGLPVEYVGLTNQQLWDQYGVALGGAIAPSDAYTVPGITGLVGPIE